MRSRAAPSWSAVHTSTTLTRPAASRSGRASVSARRASRRSRPTDNHVRGPKPRLAMRKEERRPAKLQDRRASIELAIRIFRPAPSGQHDQVGPARLPDEGPQRPIKLGPPLAPVTEAGRELRKPLTALGQLLPKRAHLRRNAGRIHDSSDADRGRRMASAPRPINLPPARAASSVATHAGPSGKPSASTNIMMVG
jgi:hypothetical protein